MFEQSGLAGVLEGRKGSNLVTAKWSGNCGDGHSMVVEGKRNERVTERKNEGQSQDHREEHQRTDRC